MEVKKDGLGMLDMIIRPGFCVKENLIVKVNSAAQALLITPGIDVRELLMTGQEEYEAFEDGCLYLTLSLSSSGCGASVTRMEDLDVFMLDQEGDDSELRVLALAAQELRKPLTSVMASAKQLTALTQGDTVEYAARLNRGLHQLLRVISNMSDAGRYAICSRQETRDIGALFAEMMEKAQILVEHTGIRFHYQGLAEEVLCLADGEQLERAVLNILSNAVKFTPAGGIIDVSLSRREKLLQLRVWDSGSGIAECILGNVFSRYLRQPGLEDSRHGLGLGMVLIRSAAANHGGTVLIDQPQETGTRITMTMSIRQNTDTRLHSPVMRIDYTGGWDHGLIELSESLPVSVYEAEK